MAEPDYIRLPVFQKLLREQYGVCVSYQTLWRAVVDGLVPGTRIGRLVHVDRAHLPMTAEQLRARFAPKTAA